MKTTKGLTRAEKKEYAELRLIPSYEARKRLAELQGKIVAASQQKATQGNLKRKKPIRKVSEKQAKVNAEYTKLRKVFLEQHPKCQWPGCNAEATDIHHRGKRGKNTNVAELFMACCRPHHEEIETHKAMARANGYIIDTYEKH